MKNNMDTKDIAEKLNRTMGNVSVKTRRLDTDDFFDMCADEIMQYYKEKFNAPIAVGQTKTVWYSKSIQNHKCTMIALYPDNLYFEFTYNGDLGELYMDVYQKIEKRVL